VSVLVLTHLVHGALCWGKDGHYTVCKLAEGFFEDDTIAAVKKLLPESVDGGGLADFCSWPDEIKKLSQWQWTSTLHYVNTPEYRCNYEYCRGLSFPPASYMFLFCFCFHWLCIF
jgi:hypothetical protein